VKFIKTIGENGMSATIRLGPFIQAEWNHGYESTPCFLLLIIAYFILLHTPLYVYLSYTLFSMWSLRGLPYWLREIPDIIFRSDNAPFKVIASPTLYKKKFCEIIKHSIWQEVSKFAASYGEIRYNDHQQVERREIVCITRRSHHLGSGLFPL